MTHSQDYVQQFYEAQNIGADETQKNLYPMEGYQKLYDEVWEVLKEGKDASLEELREKLIQKSGIISKFRNFFLKRQMAPGAVLTIGTKNYQHTFFGGNQEEVVATEHGIEEHIEPMREDTIFDLASTTKIFTAVATLKLVEMGLMNMTDDIVKYAPQFENLKGVTIFDLLTFAPLKTDKRVDAATSVEEAESILFTTSRKELKEGENAYNDFSSMVLKYAIEKVTGMDYYSFLKCSVIDTLGMEDTFVRDEAKLDRIASGNCDIRYYQDGNVVERNYIAKGISTDDKARVLGQKEGVLSGHAGLFSTARDMSQLANALIDGTILNLEVRDEMAKNRTGRMYLKEDGSKAFVQYLGMLCYSKCPNLGQSEVHHPLSGKSFAIAGWSGTQLTIDPIHGIHLFMGANRSHNRLTINGQKDKTLTDAQGRKIVILPDGREKIDASRFAFDRDDALIHPGVELALQLKMLEDITGTKEVEEAKVLRKTPAERRP